MTAVPATVPTLDEVRFGVILPRGADQRAAPRRTHHGRGTRATVGPPGRGLRGMRRRIEELDGRLEAGPRDGGGFQVVARLPVPAATR